MEKHTTSEKARYAITAHDRQRLIKKLRLYHQECDLLRRALEISVEGEVIARYPGDHDVIAVADGLGGAWVGQVEGNFPVDYITHHRRTFASEDDASDFAQQLDEGIAAWSGSD